VFFIVRDTRPPAVLKRNNSNTATSMDLLHSNKNDKINVPSPKLKRLIRNGIKLLIATTIYFNDLGLYYPYLNLFVKNRLKTGKIMVI
jgi:hypothetical protein